MHITYDDRMTAADAIFTRLDDDPRLRGTANAVLFFEGKFDPERYRHKQDWGLALIPRMRQRVVASPGSTAPPRWVDDPDFDRTYHVQWMKAPGDGTLRALLDWAAPWAQRAFDPYRPLWEELVVEDVYDPESGVMGTALLRKQHHAMTDGVGGMELARALLDFEPDPDEERAPTPSRLQAVSAGRLFVDGWVDEARRLASVARRGGRFVARAFNDPSTRAQARRWGRALAAQQEHRDARPSSSLATGRSAGAWFDVVRHPLDEFKAGARAGGGTINDGLLAAITVAVHRYHADRGVALTELRTNMAVNLRGADEVERAGNVITGALFGLPAATGDVRAALPAVGAASRAVRGDVDRLQVQGAITGVLTRLPQFAAHKWIAPAVLTHDLSVSNVPGVPMPFWLAGAPNRFLCPLGPRVGAGINVTLITMHDQATFGLNIDPAAYDDPQALSDHFRDAVREVAAIAHS